MHFSVSPFIYCFLLLCSVGLFWLASRPIKTENNWWPMALVFTAVFGFFTVAPNPLLKINHTVNVYVINGADTINRFEEIKANDFYVSIRNKYFEIGDKETPRESGYVMMRFQDDLLVIVEEYNSDRVKTGRTEYKGGITTIERFTSKH